MNERFSFLRLKRTATLIQACIRRIEAERVYLDKQIAQSVQVLDQLTVLKVERKPIVDLVVHVPCLDALFEAARTAFMDIEKTHFRLVRLHKETETKRKIVSV
jgi:hypothetical protein